MSDAWSLKGKLLKSRDSGHCYSVYDINILRKKLIEDMRTLAKDEWYDVPCHHLLNDMEKLINKRFGVDSQ